VEYGARAIQDQRFGEPHRSFVKELEWDASALPLYRGKHAGIGGVYRISKA
jgi:hypothetical protein